MEGGLTSRHARRSIALTFAALFAGVLFFGIAIANAQTESLSVKLLADDGQAQDRFGHSISLSGDTALIGAVIGDGVAEFSGSAYVFVRTGGTWSQQAKLIAADGAFDKRFGEAVSVSGDTAVIASPRDDARGERSSGSAYVFVRNSSTWTQQAKLIAADGAANDSFGWSVAVSGDVVVIGAPFNDDLGVNSGAAYVFVRNGITWTQQAKRTAADGRADDYFGRSVSISGDTVAVGAVSFANNNGAAYIFVRNGTNWTQQKKLLSDDGAENDYFGSPLILSGNTLLVGAMDDEDLGSDSEVTYNTGSTYVFVRDGVNWLRQEKLLAIDETSGDEFGVSVFLSGDTAVIGAAGNDDLGANSGSAYVFLRSGSSWTQQAKLLA